MYEKWDFGIKICHPATLSFGILPIRDFDIRTRGQKLINPKQI
jgi:hypothetical protein